MARSSLSESAFEPSPREAYLLLGHALGLSETQVMARWDDEVDGGAERQFRELLERRLRGEPVAYLLGRREFYGRSFRVDSRVLIPRPETEHLVELALSLPLPAEPAILDLGTGSGCIAVTLALEIPQATVTAVDISLGALAVARRNARELGDEASCRRIRFLAGDLAGAIDLDGFDLVVSNPPYVDLADKPSLSSEIHEFEPHLALFSPGGGASTIDRLVSELAGLPPGAHLIFEIGQGQADRVVAAVSGSQFELATLLDDYQGIPRTAVARRT